MRLTKQIEQLSSRRDALAERLAELRSAVARRDVLERKRADALERGESPPPLPTFSEVDDLKTVEAAIKTVDRELAGLRDRQQVAYAEKIAATLAVERRKAEFELRKWQMKNYARVQALMALLRKQHRSARSRIADVFRDGDMRIEPFRDRVSFNMPTVDPLSEKEAIELVAAYVKSAGDAGEE